MSDQLAHEHNQTQIAWQRFSVPYEFPVCFTTDLFNPENNLLPQICAKLEPTKRHKLILFIDSGVVEARETLIDEINRFFIVHEKYLALVTEPIVIQSGESLKSDAQLLQSIQRRVFENHIDRHSFLVGIGGGALLDVVGLVAATAHRGIRHIRIPTTVLAQNDSGVGVKNGINQFGQKNYFGTFAPPYAVINDYNFIRYLPDREKVSGMAEAVKVALIRDYAFYVWLEDNSEALSNFDHEAVQYMIRRCAELHMYQIGSGGDPFENGSARPLDFGHWAAHKLETMTNYAIRHGEAVAIGMAIDTYYSSLSGLLPMSEADRVCSLLEKLGFNLWNPVIDNKNDANSHILLQGLVDFREHLGGDLTITLLSSVGTGIEVNTINENQMVDSLMYLKNRQDQAGELRAV